MVDEEWLLERVERERMRQHMRGHALTAMSGFLPIGYLVWLLQGTEPIAELQLWAACLVVVDVIAIAHAAVYLRRPTRATSTFPSWRHRQIALQALAGFVWSCAGIWIPHSADAQTNVLVLLVAVMAIGVIGLIHYHAAVISYTTAVMAVPAVLALLGDHGVSGKLGAGLVVLLISLNFYLWESAGQFVLGLRTGFYAAAMSREYQTIADRNHELATTDELTHLLNRREGMRLLQAIPRDGSTQYALIVVDIDHFKAINDTHGHLTGDDVLSAVAARLRANLPAEAVLSRIGGEEFMVLLPAGHQEQATAVAQGLRGAVSGEPVETRSGELTVTASFGVAESEESLTPLELFARADRALYDAKNAGRDRVRWHQGMPKQDVGHGATP